MGVVSQGRWAAGDKVFCVAVDGDRVWAGTDNGLGLYEDGKWKSYGVKDGLAYPAVLSLAVDRAGGDLWAATMKGLPVFGRPLGVLHPVQQRPAERCGVRRRRGEPERVGCHHGRDRAVPAVREKKWNVWTRQIPRSTSRGAIS